ncbi:MAG TPA: hypothetical protein DD490_00545 [Acidobacteria bacterium]|nr:hypothetical protein [Acidobacteriota bacterium]
MAELRRGPYIGPACPRCRMPLDLEIVVAGEQSCPACNHRFEATPFAPPEERAEVVASLLEAGPDGGLPCGRHAGNAAVAHCSRCGVFMCALCRITMDGLELCPSCFDRLASEGALPSAQTRVKDFRGLAVSVGLFGCLVSFFGLLTGPVALYFVWRGFRQRRELGERGGMVSLILSALLALLQIGGSIFILYAFLSEVGK